MGEHEPKTYRIARFDRLEVLNEPTEVPGDFDLKAYFGNAWAVFRGAKTFNVRIKFLPAAARQVASMCNERPGCVWLLLLYEGIINSTPLWMTIYSKPIAVRPFRPKRRWARFISGSSSVMSSSSNC